MSITIIATVFSALISSIVGLNLIPLHSSDAYDILREKTMEFGIPRPNMTVECDKYAIGEEISDLAVSKSHSVYVLSNSRNQSVLFGQGSYGTVMVLAIWKKTKLQFQAFKYLNLPIPHLLIREIDNNVFLQRSKYVPKFLGLLSIEDFLVPGFSQELAAFYSNSIRVVTLDDFVSSEIDFNWIDLCLSLSLALSDLHRVRRYFHGDLKPNNVLVRLDESKNISIVLIDFGQAGPVGEMSYLLFSGSFEAGWYAAPELAKGYSLSEKTDIFSLGFVFREIASLKSVKFLDLLGRDCMNDDPEYVQH